MKNFFTLFILPVFLFSSCGKNFSEEEKNLEKKSEIFTLKSENFSYYLDLTGILQAKSETPVAAKQSGRISEMGFEIGDFVFKDTLLGKLAGDESKVNYQTALTNESNLRNLLLSQEKVLNESIKNAEKNLEIAEKNLEAVSIQKNASSLTLDEQKKLAEKKVNEAEIFLENTEKNNFQNLENFYENGISQIRSGFLISTKAVNFLDNLLGISDENKNKNDQFEGNLGTLKTETKLKANNSTRLIVSIIDDFENFFETEIKNQNPSSKKIDEGLEKILDVLEDLQIALQDSYEMLQNSTSGANFTETQLSNFKTQNLSFGQSVESAITNGESGVKYLIIQIGDLKVKNENSAKSAKSALESAKQSLLQISASSDQSFSDVSSQKEIAQKKVEQAKIALQSAIVNKESSLKDLESKIDLASGNKNLYQVAVGNTQIGSPFNGVITEKLVEVGQVVAAGQAVYKVADISEFKIISDISDTKIGKLKIGQEAVVEVDGISGKFNAALSKISPKLDPISRNVILEFKVEGTNSAFKIGAFSRIKLKITDKNSFLIPRKFIKTDFDGNFITLKNGEKKYVKIGKEENGKIKIWFEGEMEGIEIIKK